MAKPMKTLELHYPMIQLLINTNIFHLTCVKLTTGLENFEGPFFRFSSDRQKLLVDPTPVVKFVS